MKKSLLRESLRIARSKNTPDLHDQWGKYHHYTFIVQKNKLLGYGTNKEPVGLLVAYGYRQSSKIHSEVAAYWKVKGLLNGGGWEVLNIRLNKQNELRMSAPCTCCKNFLFAAGCTGVSYSTNEGIVQLVI